MKLAPLAVLALLATSMSVAPDAAAFHGAYYKATGIATTADNHVLLANVEWMGWQFHGFRVTLMDPTTHAIVAQKQFVGDEAFLGPFFYVGEAFLYHGYSLDPAVSFDIQGTFVNAFNVPPYAGQMVYVGNFGAYAIKVVVVQAAYRFVDLQDPTGLLG